MDLEMEKKIAGALFYKNKRERFLYERQKGIELYYQVTKLPNIVDETLCIMKSTTFPSIDSIIAIMKDNGVKEQCYVISEYEEYNGVYKPLQEAITALNQNGFASIIVGLPSGFSHLKDESWASSQPICFVRPKRRLDGQPW